MMDSETNVAESPTMVDRSISALSSVGNSVGQRVKLTEAPRMRKIIKGCNISNAVGIMASGLVRLATLGDCTGDCPLESTFVVGFYSL